FWFEVVAHPSGDADRAVAEIGAPATLRILGDDGSARAIETIVDAVIAHGGGAGDRQGTHGPTEIRLVPRLALLADGVDHAVFLDQDALQIAEAVLSAHGYKLQTRCERALDRRPQRVQAFESDLDFVSRILADEGIVWFLHPEEA